MGLRTVNSATTRLGSGAFRLITRVLVAVVHLFIVLIVLITTYYLSLSRSLALSLSRALALLFSLALLARPSTASPPFAPCFSVSPRMTIAADPRSYM